MSAKSIVQSHVAAYEKSCLDAVKWALGAISKKIAGRARQLAPRADRHRETRTYPGGRRYSGEARISRSIISRVRAPRRMAQNAYGMVRVKVGYGVFLEYGTKFMRAAKGAYSYTRRALDENRELAVQYLKGAWPK